MVTSCIDIISQTLLNWHHTLSEQGHVQFLESDMVDGGVKVNTFMQNVDSTSDLEKPKAMGRILEMCLANKASVF
nr:hypothetical protein [Tanacetum cinerariifolium]